MTPDPAGSDAGPRLLAVDAGLRAGLAVYGPDGRLERYRSTNFGTPRRLRAGVYGVLQGVEGLARLVVEGGGSVADPWLRQAERRGVPALQVHAGVWREALLHPRDRRTGADAKEQADALARRVIAWSHAPRPTSLRHDAAEAILLGLWAVLDAGWIAEPPPAIARG